MVNSTQLSSGLTLETLSDEILLQIFSHVYQRYDINLYSCTFDKGQTYKFAVAWVPSSDLLRITRRLLPIAYEARLAAFSGVLHDNTDLLKDVKPPSWTMSDLEYKKMKQRQESHRDFVSRHFGPRIVIVERIKYLAEGLWPGGYPFANLKQVKYDYDPSLGVQVFEDSMRGGMRGLFKGKYNEEIERRINGHEKLIPMMEIIAKRRKEIEWKLKTFEELFCWSEDGEDSRFDDMVMVSRMKSSCSTYADVSSQDHGL